MGVKRSSMWQSLHHSFSTIWLQNWPMANVFTYIFYFHMCLIYVWQLRWPIKHVRKNWSAWYPKLVGNFLLSIDNKDHQANWMVWYSWLPCKWVRLKSTTRPCLSVIHFATNLATNKRVCQLKHLRNKTICVGYPNSDMELSQF